MKTEIFVDKKAGTITVSGLGLAIDKRKQGWIAYCPSLKVLGYSNESEQNAIDEFNISIDAFFNIHLTDGTLGEALTEFGWKPRVSIDPNSSMPMFETNFGEIGGLKQNSFKIPVPLA